MRQETIMLLPCNCLPLSSLRKVLSAISTAEENLKLLQNGITTPNGYETWQTSHKTLVHCENKEYGSLCSACTIRFRASSALELKRSEVGDLGVIETLCTGVCN